MHAKNLGTMPSFLQMTFGLCFSFSGVESGVELRSMTSLIFDIQATTTNLMHGSRSITIETVSLTDSLTCIPTLLHTDYGLSSTVRIQKF